MHIAHPVPAPGINTCHPRITPKIQNRGIDTIRSAKQPTRVTLIRMEPSVSASCEWKIAAGADAPGRTAPMLMMYSMAAPANIGFIPLAITKGAIIGIMAEPKAILDPRFVRKRLRIMVTTRMKIPPWPEKMGENRPLRKETIPVESSVTAEAIGSVTAHMKISDLYQAGHPAPV